jgi:hypothetical protein
MPLSLRNTLQRDRIDAEFTQFIVQAPARDSQDTPSQVWQHAWLIYVLPLKRGRLLVGRPKQAQSAIAGDPSASRNDESSLCLKHSLLKS